MEKSTFKKFQKILNSFKGDRGWKSKIRLLEALCNLVVRVYAKFEECAAETVGGTGFLMKAYLSGALLVSGVEGGELRIRDTLYSL